MTEIIRKREEVFFNHITLFSIVGILTIVLNDFFAFIVGMEIPKWFVSPQDWVSAIAFPVAILIFVFLYGYYFKYANSLFKDDNAVIPEVSLNCFMVFVKMLPVFLFWNIYMFAGIFIGIALFKLGSLSSYIYFSLLSITGIFVNVIYILYAKELKPEKRFFTLNFLKNIIIKTFWNVINVSIQVVVMFGAAIYLFYKYYTHLAIIKDHEHYFCATLFGMCFTAYIISLIHLYYVKKLVKIAKNKLN